MQLSDQQQQQQQQQQLIDMEDKLREFNEKKNSLLERKRKLAEANLSLNKSIKKLKKNNMLGDVSAPEVYHELCVKEYSLMKQREELRQAWSEEKLSAMIKDNLQAELAKERKERDQLLAMKDSKNLVQIKNLRTHNSSLRKQLRMVNTPSTFENVVSETLLCKIPNSLSYTAESELSVLERDKFIAAAYIVKYQKQHILLNNLIPALALLQSELHGLSHSKQLCYNFREIEKNKNEQESCQKDIDFMTIEIDTLSKNIASRRAPLQT